MVFTGVTVLFRKPDTVGVNTTVMFSESFPEEVIPPDAKQTHNPHATGACWTKADDESVSRYGESLNTKRNINQQLNYFVNIQIFDITETQRFQK